MNCPEARQWLTAQLDGELDLGRDAELTAHVQGCAACAARREQQRAWRDTLREKLPRWSPPAPLATRIRADLRAAGGATDTASARPGRRWFSPGWIGAAAGIAAALAIAFVGGERHERTAQLGDELVSAHAVAVTRGQLTDVLSSDRHTVKPWLAEHLDFSPPVNDFAAAGFPLVGGRIERLQGRAVAALVYQRHKHVITVYVAPAATVIFPGAGTRRGYHLRSWRDGDLSFVAVSDVATEELDEFAARCRAGLK